MLKRLSLFLVATTAAILLYAATRPNEFRVERSILIAAPPEEVFAMIHDFHAWRAWSPYEKLDPAMERSYAGAVSGVGARYGWDSRGDAGSGSMEIVEAVAPERVSIRLEFTKPFVAHNIADFTLQPRGDAVEVTWAMHGPAPFLSKLVGVFLDMDRMIGADFEAGLATLKHNAEQ